MDTQRFGNIPKGKALSKEAKRSTEEKNRLLDLKEEKEALSKSILDEQAKNVVGDINKGHGVPAVANTTQKNSGSSSLDSFIELQTAEKEPIPTKQIGFRIPLDLLKDFNKKKGSASTQDVCLALIKHYLAS